MARDGAALCAGEPGAGVVQIRNYAFHPAELNVTAGTTVTWVNCDGDVHTTTADSGVWNSGLLSRTSTFTQRFSQPGRFSFHCQPHPFMKGAVTVK